MVIDYLAVMLLNLSFGLFVAGIYFLKLDYLNPKSSEEEMKIRKSFSVVGMGSGLLAFILGLSIVLTWPLIGSYNILFGEAYTIYGLILLIASFVAFNGWDLRPVGYFSLFAGIYAFVDAYGVYIHNFTTEPLLTVALYSFLGIAAIMITISVHTKNVWVWRLTALFLFLAMIVAMIVGYGAALQHLGSFATYKP
ncbi:MAG: DUF981 family protein [Thermoplasmata archaeon]